MAKFRKKEVEEVEAIRFTGGPENASIVIDWVKEHGGEAWWLPGTVYNNDDGTALPTPRSTEQIVIKTTDGTTNIFAGEWAICDFLGGFTPCTPGFFEQTWEEAA